MTTPHISDLIEQNIGPTLQRFPESISVNDIAENLASFANTQGGHILLGIAPKSGKVSGVQDIENTLDKIFQAALLTDPVLVLPLPQINRVAEGNLIVIEIPPGLPHVYSLDGRYLHRQGAKNTTISAKTLRQLLITRGVIQFESQIPENVSLDDLDQTQTEAYLAAINQSNTNWQDALVQRGCLIQDGKNFQPTNAALLLFGKNPQRWFPNANILAARFPGVSFSDEFLKQDIGGSIPQQLRQAETFIKDNLRQVVRMVGLAHEETPEYPYEAVRELLVNAVAHRDYNQQGDNVHLYIFSDRLEVHSPGGLPGPVNLENLLEARFSRNAVIVQILSDLGFIERLGYGLNRVVTAMRQHAKQPPTFAEEGGAFRVTLQGEAYETHPLPDMSAYKDLALNPRQELLLSYLTKNPRITNSIYQELCPDVHTESLRRDFADLVKKNILLKMGSKRATYYILKSGK